MRGERNLEGQLVPCAYYSTLKSCNRNSVIVIFSAWFGHEEHEGCFPKTEVLPAWCLWDMMRPLDPMHLVLPL